MSRNIILITYDSLRADHCGFMGYDRDTTPALDELAAEGTVFRNTMASGVPTIASMTSVMTGEHSLASPEIGFNTEQRNQITSRATLAEVLSDAGYSTCGVSPNPPASSYFGFDQGFDHFEDFLHQDRGVVERAWNRIFRRSIRGGQLTTYLRLLRNVVRREEVLRPWEDYYDVITEWRSRVTEPYFLWVLLLEPHHPWLPPKRRQRWSTSMDKYRSFHHYWQMLNSGWEPDFTPRTRQRLIDLYDDSIRYGDMFLHRLRRDLADDDPVIVVHADHGEEFGEHGRYGHQPYLYESLVHVPLVIAGTNSRSEVTEPVGLRSLAATIAGAADVSHPFSGQNILTDAHKRPWTTSKVFVGESRRISIRSRRYKYLEDSHGRELYDLGKDPSEQENLVTDRPALTATLEDVAGAHLAEEMERRATRAAASEVILEGQA